MDDALEAIVQTYEQRLPLYADLASRLETLIRQVIASTIRVHSIESRAKSVDNLQRKIYRPGKHYSTLTEITDLAGVRIITFFADEVDLVAQLIKHEFVIDEQQSVDKRQEIESDRFGYLSLHFIARVAPERLQLTEWNKYADLTFEVQIRSLLQHTWAEIEHDLGYKAPDTIPRPFRRRFSRLAGLLEIADSEFIQLRTDLAEYIKRTDLSANREPAAIPVEKESLASFIHSNTRVVAIDSSIAAAVGATLRAENRELESLAVALHSIGIHTIADIEIQLEHSDNTVTRFASALMSKQRVTSIEPGTSLFYLVYYIISKSQSAPVLSSHLQRIGLDQNEAEYLTEKLLTAFEAVADINA